MREADEEGIACAPLMKLFTASGAVRLAGLMVVLTGFRLLAQDVMVSDLAWFEPQKSEPETPPVFAKKPRPDYPDRLEKDQPGYLIATRHVDEDGKFRKLGDDWASHPYFREGYNLDKGAKFEPAKKGGEAVGAVAWYAVIFTPKESPTKAETAQPRLLAVTPVTVEKEALTKVPGVKSNRVTVWAKVAVDEAGVPAVVSIDDPAYERFRGAIEGFLPAWKFAPARKGGKPVAAEIPVAFLVLRAPKWNTGVVKAEQMPKAISQVRPTFPLSLRRTRQQGEVLLQFTVDKDGSVKDVVVKRSDHPDFEQPALDAVLKWKFKPAMAGGKPMAMKLQQAVIFNLHNTARSGAMHVEEVSAKRQAQLPEGFRYDVEPKIKGLLYPAYPYELLIEKARGKAEVAFIVAADGKVRDVKVLSATRPEFGEALSAAVTAYEFIPASKDGKPVEALLKMEHEFNAGGWTGRPSTEDRELAALVRKNSDKIVEPKTLDAVPRPLSRRAPVFPATGKADAGEAVIEVFDDSDGHARLPRIVSATEPAFGYAAAQAAGEWRFEVPKAGGKAAVTRLRIPFRFGAKVSSSAKAPENGSGM